MIRKYHNFKPQTNPWHCKEEPHNHHKTPGRQTKQSNQLSFPHQSNVQQNIEQLQTVSFINVFTKTGCIKDLSYFTVRLQVTNSSTLHILQFILDKPNLRSICFLVKYLFELAQLQIAVTIYSFWHNQRS